MFRAVFHSYLICKMEQLCIWASVEKHYQTPVSQKTDRERIKSGHKNIEISSKTEAVFVLNAGISS